MVTDHCTRYEGNSELLLMNLLSCSSDYAIIAIDSQQNIRIWSKGAEQMFGYTVEETLNAPCFFKVDTTRYAMNNIFFYKAGTSSDNFSYEAELQHKNGQSIYTRISVSTCSCAGDEGGYLLLVKDISEENHRDKLRNIIIEIAHIANQPKDMVPMLEDIMLILQRYLDIPAAFICLSHDGVQFKVAAQEGLLPCSLEDSCRPYDVSPSHQSEGCVEACTQLLISHEPLENHRIYRCMNHVEQIHEQMLIVHIPLLSDIAVMGVLHMVIPERFQKLYMEESQIMSVISNKLTSSIKNKKLEKELHNYADNLERIVQERTDQLREKDAQLVQSGKLATLGEMATGIAHEINQPLGGISLMTQGIKKALEKGKLTDEVLMTRLKSINEQIERINKIINHLRIFGRQAPESKAPININKPLHDVLELIGQQLANHNIDISLNLTEPLPLILADSNRLEQVYLNIVNNAKDALEDQELRVQRLQLSSNPPEWTIDWQKQIFISSTVLEDQVILSITDNAGGIPERVKEKIFEPFFTTKQVGKGTGLGLSISYGIVKEFGGEILISTAEDIGTTFTTVFPVLKTESSP